MTVGSLFAGIGGFDLGFERAGFGIRWQVEIDPWCRAVLAQHWPHVRRYDDVRTVADLEWVDVLCAGFPCQPVSSAARGRSRGTADHHWLWPSVRRVNRLIKPTWFLGENVTHLDGVPLETVVSDLEADGYEVAPPLEIPACAFGHDHRRSRLWILGYAHGDRQSGMPVDAEMAGVSWGRDDAGRVGATDGLSRGLDARRMAALGNAVVPAIAEWYARHIRVAHEVTR